MNICLNCIVKLPLFHFVFAFNLGGKRTEIVTEGKRLIEGIWFETTFLLEAVLVRSLRQYLFE